MNHSKDHSRLISEITDQLKSIEVQSYKALKGDLDNENALYTINQKTHEVLRVINTYFITCDKDNDNIK